MLQDGSISAYREDDFNTLSAMNRSPATLSNSDFTRLSRLIQDYCGIKMPPVKKTMLEGRLRKRMQALGMHSFADYCNFLFDSKSVGDEHVRMFDAVTTNKTDFFRESDHFDYLVRRVLPELVSTQGMGSRKPLKIWSAGCSTGEEPYTLAMVISEFVEKIAGFNFSILGTDISTRVLAKAAAATYPHESIDPVPMTLRKKYLLKSKSENGAMVRIVPELRASVRFARLNLMEDDYGLREQMSIIFCRNVIIYFDRPTQEKVLSRLAGHLVSGGYLFMGHSETAHDMDLPLVQMAATVHRKI